MSKFLFVFHIIFEFYVKMLKFLGITIALLTVELVGVTITLIIVTTTGDDQELNQSAITITKWVEEIWHCLEKI